MDKRDERGRFAKGRRMAGEQSPMYGRKLSPETIEKLREAQLCHPTRYWLGKKRPDIGEKVRARLKGKPAYANGLAHHAWRGGSSYWWHQQARGIMAEKLGRPLTRNEIVHHIDGNWRNNALSNLEITTRSEHIKEHLARGDIKPGVKQPLSIEHKRRISEGLKRAYAERRRK